MTGIRNNKNRGIKFFLLIYVAIFLILIIKDKYIGSGAYAMGKLLSWKEILNNTFWYLVFSFFGALLFSYVHTKRKE